MTGRARGSGTYRAGDAVDRRPLLRPATPLPEPSWLPRLALDVHGLARVGDALRHEADRHGAVAVQLDRPLAADELLAFAEEWGAPLPEHDPAVAPFVERDCILTLEARWPATTDVSRQPFSASPILLHSEGSRRSRADQPRFLVFSCQRPPAPGEGGQTVLVRMDAVAGRLPAEATATLAGTRYRGSDMPPLLRHERGRPVFSFRDFGDAPLDWEADHDDQPRTGAALDALMRSLYDADAVAGLTWARGLVVVVDNHRLFHGRTGRRPVPAGAARLVQRVRVGAPPTPAGTRYREGP